MNLSLQEAAEILGKTRRQVLYMIQQGHLPAQKIGGRWVVERADLQVDPEVQQRASVKQERLKAAVEDALTPSGKKRRFRLNDLKAVQLGTPIYRQLLERGKGCEKAAAYMRECLDQLALGCHRYDWRDKAAAYRAARDAASLAAIELLLGDDSAKQELLDAIEQELMATFAGLLRRSESN